MAKKKQVCRPRLQGLRVSLALQLTGMALVWAFFLQSTPLFASEPASPSVPKTSFTSATECGRCHIDIYDHWRNSLHARSVDDPIFRAAYYEAYTTTGGEAKFLCLKCHAPTTQVTKDYDLQKTISKEGVTCDYCHSITAVSPESGGYPFEVETGPIKRGPWKDSQSKVHQSAYSPLFQSSVFCSGCHEFTNQYGLRVLETFSEWERSPYAKEGVMCQNCHMPRVEGSAEALGTRTASRGYVNLHRLAGGSSTGQLQKALAVNIETIERRGGNLEVEVALSNKGAGHMVPTGLPGRTVVLEVTVRSRGKHLHTQEQTYQRILLDGEGNEIERAPLLFDAQAIAQDNRLAPRETRRERFSFTMAPSQRAEVSAKVYYQYEPFLIEKKQIKLEVASKERVVPVGEVH